MKNAALKKDKDKEEAEIIVRRKNSDDEDDEFFDRTKSHQFKTSKKNEADKNVPVNETYESIKAKLESLIRDRQKLTDEMQNQGSK